MRWMCLLVSAAMLLPAATAAFGADCNGNGIEDATDIAGGGAIDCNANGVPDSCEVSLVIDRTTAATGTPLGLASADFNADGFTDLAYADRGANAVAVLLGNGAGGFTAQSFSVGTLPVWIAVGDFNNDSRIDIASANAASNTVSLLFNTGGSGAQLMSLADPLQVGFTPTYILATDIDADGDLDLATCAGVPGLQGTVDILINNGLGAFAVTNPQTVGSGPLGIAAGDFDGDGEPDLAVANETSNNLTVLLSSGVVPAPTQVTLGTPVSVAAGDFDGDGRADLAVANFNSSRVLILRSNGDGTFASGQELADVANPIFVGTRDVDGDGRRDLLVSGVTGIGAQSQSTVAFYAGRGNGQFLLAQKGTFAGSVNSLVFARLVGTTEQIAGLDDQGVRVVLLTPQGPTCSDGTGGETPPPPAACGAGVCGAGGATLMPLTLAGLLLIRTSAGAPRGSRRPRT